MPGKMTASRTGVAVHAKLSSLEFKLLSHFLISGDETTSLDSLKNNWQKFSTSKARSRDPVDKGISRLNGKIKPLGLIVEAPLPGGGWKLSESGPEKRGIARLTECLTEL